VNSQWWKIDNIEMWR